MNKKYDIKSAKQIFRESGLELLEEVYVNTTTPMKYRCKCGSIDYKSLDSAIKKSACGVCAREKTVRDRRLSYVEVKKVFEGANCTLLSDTYKNARTPLDYICSCGKVSKIRYDNFRQGKRCADCRNVTVADKRRHDIDHVRDMFAKEGCVLLSETYTNTKELLSYICSCGDESYISFGNFQHGQRCRRCGIKKISGESSPHYKHDIPLSERVISRNFPALREWRDRVFMRDSYKCVVCGTGGKLNAHHLDAYHLFKEKRTDVDNGVTLCQRCHLDFHNKFGRKNNTSEQFRQFLN